jgi:tmRNA-binding protein
LSEARVKPVRQSSNELNLSWRDQRYVTFYKVVDELVDELQEQAWMEQEKRRLLKFLINRQHTPQFKQKISLQDYASIHATFF